ncbi:unnamed protein product [Echinostoma caproni]|uniref:DUF3074 domain-containing protein n=1 Tax=Echinostoma caproni TaxID=27848 RepID=A0A183A3C3_9TREM|nr:unnamed protein product [Echinostoma caproni]
MDLCGWSNDQNNWRHAWSLSDQIETHSLQEKLTTAIDRALCLSATDKLNKFSRGRSSSSTRRHQVSNSIDEPIQARLWSPQFLREDMLQSGSLSKKLLDCDYTRNSSAQCRWNPDHNDWGRYRWRVQSISSLLAPSTEESAAHFALCLHRPATIRTTETLISRLWSPSVGDGKEEDSEELDSFSSDEFNDATIDFASAFHKPVLMDKIGMPQCLQVSYRYFPGRLNSNSDMSFNRLGNNSQPTLALLKRQKG